MSQKTKPFGCPHCGNRSGFTEADIVCATAAIDSFDEHGEPNYTGESEVDWNSQDLDPAESEPYACDACGGSFVRPVAVSRERRNHRA
jgi:hypothetical protein